MASAARLATAATTTRASEVARPVSSRTACTAVSCALSGQMVAHIHAMNSVAAAIQPSEEPDLPRQQAGHHQAHSQPHAERGHDAHRRGGAGRLLVVGER